MRRLTACALVLAASVAVAHAAPRPRAEISPFVPVPAGAPRPDAALQIAWDSLGVPHIAAATRLDAYFGLGVALAHDRLFEMDYLRRRARGESASMLGNAALRADGFVRLLGLGAAADRFAAAQPADAWSTRILDRFTDGVNAGMALWPSPPAEYRACGASPRPWRRADIIALVLAQGLTLDFDTGELEEAARRAAWPLARWAEWTRHEPWVRYASVEGRTVTQSLPPLAGALPPRGAADDASPGGDGYAAARAFLGPDDDARRQASNAWVVSGARAAGGKPLLANDPHLDLTAPSIWYCAHLHVDDSLDVAGVLVPGVPFIASGRNAHVAWGITALGADVVDFTTELISPDKRAVLRDGAWVPMQRAPLGLRYKLGPLSLPVPVARRLTPGGVLLTDDSGGRRGYAVRWAPLERATFDCSYFGIEDVRSVAELRARLRGAETPTLNVVAADDAGHIAYQTIGLIPRRDAPPLDTPAPGWVAPVAWRGFVPFDSLPAVMDPARGYCVTANNAPALDCAWLGDYSVPEYRARRVAELLEQAPAAMTLDDMARIQLDTQTPDAREFLPAMLALAERTTPGARERQALDLLRAWDRDATQESVGETLFRAWWGRLAAHTPALAHRAVWARALDGQAQADWWDDPATAARETAPQVCATALREACDKLAASYGGDLTRWHYGPAHRARFAHPLDSSDRTWGAEIASAGDPHSVRHGNSQLPASPYSTHAASWRLLVDLSTPNELRCVLPPGNGATPDPAMLRRWADGRYATLTLAMPTDATARLRLAP